MIYRADKRYTVQREWCGYAEPRYVVRFCDEWVDQATTLADALGIITLHKERRNMVLEGHLAS